jgi:hypothetical protein
VKDISARLRKPGQRFPTGWLRLDHVDRSLGEDGPSASREMPKMSAAINDACRAEAALAQTRQRFVDGVEAIEVACAQNTIRRPAQ